MNSERERLTPDRAAAPRAKFRGALAFALLLCLAAACSRPDYTQHSASTKPGDAPQTDTPSGAKLPRTSLPMPPVAAGRTASARRSASDEARLSGSSWTTAEGQRTRPSDFAGKVLVLDFWATYCPPCREQTPHLIEMQKRYGPQGLQVVGLNVGGDDDRPKIAGFVKEFGITYPLGFPEEEMSQLYFSDNDAIPQTYVFDRKGRLVQRFIGYDSSMPAELERIVKDALAD